ncbi:hypothetical protein ACFX13_011950 [Malus domestica]
MRRVGKSTGRASLTGFAEIKDVITVCKWVSENLSADGILWVNPRPRGPKPRSTEGETSSESLVLSGTHDHYEGVIVHINDNDLMDPATFLSLLTSSIAHWKLQGKKGVWIKLPIERVNLVEVAVKEIFWYYHAKPMYSMLVYWIPQSSHTLPCNTTHRVGIGTFVLNLNHIDITEGTWSGGKALWGSGG